MAYRTITTESLFYPVALGLAVVLVRYLERPGNRGWQRSAPRSRSRSRRGRSRLPSCRRSQRRRSSSRCSVALVGSPPVRAALRARRGRTDRARRAPGRARPLADRPAGRVQHRGRGRVRRRPGAAVPGCGTSRSSTSTSGSCPSRRSCSRCWSAAPSRAGSRARRGDDVVRRLVDARGRRLRVAVRVGPHPGSVPVLPRAAPRRRGARLGRARRSTASSAHDRRLGDRRQAGAGLRTSGSSASPRSRTRSGSSRCGRSTITSSPGATGRRSRSPASRCSPSTCSSPRGTPSPCRSSSSRSSPSCPGRSGRDSTASWPRESAHCGRAIGLRATGSTARRCRGPTRSRCSWTNAPTGSDQHERVLQPARRAGLLHRPADARRFRRDPGDAARNGVRAGPSSTRRAR